MAIAPTANASYTDILSSVGTITLILVGKWDNRSLEGEETERTYGCTFAAGYGLIAAGATLEALIRVVIGVVLIPVGAILFFIGYFIHRGSRSNTLQTIGFVVAVVSPLTASLSAATIIDALCAAKNRIFRPEQPVTLARTWAVDGAGLFEDRLSKTQEKRDVNSTIG